MKIFMTPDEVSAMRNLMDSVEYGSTDAILKAIKDNPLLDRRASEKGVVLEIDAEYMADVLNESGTVATVVYPCLKAAFGAFSGYIKNVADLAQAHAKRIAHKLRHNAARNANYQMNTADPVSCDHIIKILKANGAKKVTDLNPSQQDMLRNTYSAEVIKNAESLLLVTGDDDYRPDPNSLDKKV